MNELFLTITLLILTLVGAFGSYKLISQFAPWVAKKTAELTARTTKGFFSAIGLGGSEEAQTLTSDFDGENKEQGRPDRKAASRSKQARFEKLMEEWQQDRKGGEHGTN